MYKYKNIIALVATLAWLSFIFAAFKGFVEWYAGFVIFFWISLGILNFRHQTSLWLVKNRPHSFIRYFIFLFILGFFADYVLGQKLANLWSYPLYDSSWDWIRLYLIVYPFGGLTVIELIYFLGSILKEKFVLRVPAVTPVADKLSSIVDGLLIGVLVLYLISTFVVRIPNLRFMLFSLLLCWVVIMTIKLRYHLQHGLQWIVILFITLFMSLFLHEIPNTAVYEWRYHQAPFLNQAIFDVPLWVFFGWYLLILLMLRFWMHFVIAKHKL